MGLRGAGDLVRLAVAHVVGVVRIEEIVRGRVALVAVGGAFDFLTARTLQLRGSHLAVPRVVVLVLAFGADLPQDLLFALLDFLVARVENVFVLRAESVILVYLRAVGEEFERLDDVHVLLAGEVHLGQQRLGGGSRDGQRIAYARGDGDDRGFLFGDRRHPLHVGDDGRIDGVDRRTFGTDVVLLDGVDRNRHQGHVAPQLDEVEIGPGADEFGFGDDVVAVGRAQVGTALQLVDQDVALLDGGVELAPDVFDERVVDVQRQVGDSLAVDVGR